MNLWWKSGQAKSPNGPEPKFVYKKFKILIQTFSHFCASSGLKIFYNMCQSVIFGSLYLRKTRTLNFRVKFDFSKIRMEPVMHDFLAITENRKREIRTIE